MSLDPSFAAALAVACAVLVWPGPAPPWRWDVGGFGRRRRSGPREPDVPEVLDHIGLALRGGAGLQPCLRQVAAATPGTAGEELAAVAAAMAWGVDDEAAWSNAPPRWEPARRALVLAARGGIAPSALLSAAAADLRRDTLAGVDTATARLSVRLVLPLGLAFLPAFVLTTVVPVVLALASSVVELP